MLDWSSDEIQGYTVRLAHNWVRSLPGYDFNDVMQECAVAYTLVRDSHDPQYGPGAFMSRYKRRCSWLLSDLRRHLTAVGACDTAVMTDVSTESDEPIEPLCVDHGPGLVALKHDVRACLETAGDAARVFVGAIIDAGSVSALLQDGESTRDAIQRITGASGTTVWRQLRQWRATASAGAVAAC